MNRTLQLLLTLVLAVGEGCALICVCSGTDCHQDFCEGDICLAQIVDNSGVETRRWQCLPRNQDFQCGTSSPYHRIECCATGDRCNEHLYPNLPEEPLDAVEPRSENTRAAEPPSTVAPPSTAPVTAAAHYYCYKGSSDTPQFKVCPSMHGCFFTTRQHQDGTVAYKRGCSSLDRPCEPEDRNRKRKRCCYTNMCNNIADDDLAPGIGPDNPTEEPTNGSRKVTTDPPTYLPPSNTTMNSTSTPDPNAPVIDMGNTTEPEPSPGALASPTPDVSTPDTLEPSIRPPITTDAQLIYCYCETCQDFYCTTVKGCATIYTKTDKQRTCITDEICDNSDEGPDRVVCCKTDLCNVPPTEEPETPTPTTAVREKTPPTSDYFATVTTPTLSAPGTITSNPIPRSTNLSQSSESSISIFYFLTGVVVGIFVVIVAITAITCITIVVHHRNVMRKIKTKRPDRAEERTPTPTNSTTVQEESV